MQNKACKTAPGCYPYELFPFCRPLQSGAAWIPQNMPRLSSPKPFCGTILGKKVRFNISVISLTVPVISYRLGLSSLLFSRKKVPSVCSERTIHFRYATASIAVLFLRSWTVPWCRCPYKQRKHTVSGLHTTKCQAQPVPRLRSGSESRIFIKMQLVSWNTPMWPEKSTRHLSIRSDIQMSSIS